MRNLNQLELSAIAGCGAGFKKNDYLQIMTVFTLVGISMMGKDLIARPVCKLMVGEGNHCDNIYESKVGSIEDLSHITVGFLSMAATAGLAYASGVTLPD